MCVYVCVSVSVFKSAWRPEVNTWYLPLSLLYLIFFRQPCLLNLELADRFDWWSASPGISLSPHL